MKKAKKFLAVTLSIAMLLSTVPAFSFPAAAAGESGSGGDGDISQSSAFDALGIDTSAVPDGVDLNSAENPYGRNTFAENTVNELLMQHATTANLFGDNKALGQDMTTPFSPAYSDAVSELQTKADNKHYPTKAVAGHFTNAKDSKKAQTVTVALSHSDSNAGLFMYFSDIKSKQQGESLTLIKPNSNGIGMSGDNTFRLAGLMQKYVQVTAGDFDGDGVDEVAVFIPAVNQKRISVYDLQIDDTYAAANADTFCLAPSKWQFAWSYSLNVNTDMVSLVSGDFNRDGTDDLAMTSGVFDSPTSMVTSVAKVFFGDRMQMLQTSAGLPVGDDIVRTSVAAGDLNGDGVPELVVGGSLESDIRNTAESGSGTYNLNSRYLAVFQYNGAAKRFERLLGQNYNLFAKDSSNNYVYPCMIRQGGERRFSTACPS